jgi:hypothetical protein
MAGPIGRGWSLRITSHARLLNPLKKEKLEGGASHRRGKLQGNVAGNSGSGGKGWISG